MIQTDIKDQFVVCQILIEKTFLKLYRTKNS